MSPFSPYSGRDFSECVDSAMGTPLWEKDVGIHFAATGMSPPYARHQPEVTPSDLSYPVSHHTVDDKANTSAMQGGMPKGIATPFASCDVSEADDTRTVVTGSGPNRARVMAGQENSK
jgi:hypothetical protein